MQARAGWAKPLLVTPTLTTGNDTTKIDEIIVSPFATKQWPTFVDSALLLSIFDTKKSDLAQYSQ